MPKIAFPLFLVFFISGLSGLIYEVVWVRWFVNVFGNTVFAVSTVLGAFMAGLAVGSYSIGRYADKIQNPMRLYAILELLISASALLVFPLSNASSLIYNLVFQWTGNNVYLLTPSRFLISFLILIIPTALMGGTLPVLCDVFIKKLPSLARWLGSLYLTNVLGAVTGCTLAGFIFIPNYGVFQATIIAVAGNMLAGIVALFLSSRVPALIKEKIGDVELSIHLTREYYIACIFFCVSGFCAMACEVIWTRLFLLIYGSTTYSFTIMLAVFLAGLALGGGVFGIVSDRIKDRKELLYGLLMFLSLILGFYVLMGMFFSKYLPYVFLVVIKWLDFSWWSYIFAKIIISLIILLPIAFLSGGIFPVVVSIAVHKIGDIGRKIGSLYAFNSFGAILGSVLSGFVIIPLLGTEVGLRMIGAMFFLMAVLIMFAFQRIHEKRKYLTLIFIPVALFLAGIFPGVDRDIVSLGVYFHPVYFLDKYGNIDIEKQQNKHKLIFYKEGVTETPTIRQEDDLLFYYVDGKVEASTLIEDMRLQRMMGFLPLFFVQNPKSAVNIGLGAGVTLGALGTFPLENLHCVDIEPEIENVARKFGDYNGNIVDHPNLRLIIGDGRNYLRLTNKTYDIVTSDPFEPLVGGASRLYTFEYFKEVYDRLTPDGCATQYLPLYQLFSDDYQRIIKTFHAVFPYVTVWYTGVDSIMLGFKKEPRFNIEQVRTRIQLPAMSESLQEIGYNTIESILGSFVVYLGPDSQIIDPSIEINTDNHPVLEFNAPKAHVKETVPDNIGFLSWELSTFPENFLVTNESKYYIEKLLKQSKGLCKNLLRGRRAIYDHNYKLAEKVYRMAMSVVPDNNFVKSQLSFTLHNVAIQMLQQKKLSGVKEKLLESFSLGHRNPARLKADLALFYLADREKEKALETIRKAEEMKPNLPEIHMIKGQILLANNDLSGARDSFQKAAASGGDRLIAGKFLIRVYKKLGMDEAALAEYRKILHIKTDTITLCEYADMLIDNGKIDKARQILFSAEKLGPQEVSIKIDLAKIHLMNGDKKKAAEKIDEAFKINPGLVKSAISKDPVFTAIAEDLVLKED